jgi:hypothetical protein
MDKRLDSAGSAEYKGGSGQNNIESGSRRLKMQAKIATALTNPNTAIKTGELTCCVLSPAGENGNCEDPLLQPGC